MKARYVAGPLAALGLIAVSPELPNIQDKVHEALSGQRQGIEHVVNSSGSGFAYAQDKEARTYNPRDEFRKLGWEVFDDPELKKEPKRVFRAKILPNEIKNHLYNSGTINDLFSSQEIPIIRQILDNDQSNDELKFVFVTDDGYLAFTITTPDKSIGINGHYTAFKKLSPLDADRVRGISHLYR